MAEQLQTAKRCWATGLIWWMDLATNSFAGAGRADQQNVGVVARHFADHFEHFKHRRAPADDAVKFQIGQELLLEVADALSAVEGFGKLVEGFLKPRAVHGLWDVVVGAALDGRDGVVQRVKSGHEDHVDARIAMQRLLEECRPSMPGILISDITTRTRPCSIISSAYCGSQVPIELKPRHRSDS